MDAPPAYHAHAANDGPRAHLDRAHILHHGINCPVDMNAAARHYAMAADAGLADAQFNLGKCYFHGWGMPRDKPEAVTLYRRAAGQGHANAQFALAECYRHGHGVSCDEAQAVSLYQLAASQSHIEAQYQLGRLYYNGYANVPSNELHALAEFYAAATNGHAGAALCINKIKFRQRGGFLSIVANYSPFWQL